MNNNPGAPPPLDWTGGPTPLEGLVHGKTATLFLASDGPPRVDPSQPVVLFEAGLGATSASWGPVSRLLDNRIRSYRYDRAGYGRSRAPAVGAADASSPARTASVLAAELLDVLETAAIAPPYVVVAHSYGAVIARELLAQVGPSAVAGLVLVDANSEATHSEVRTPLMPLYELAEARGLSPMAFLDLTGVRAGRDHYTVPELERLTADMEREAATATAAHELAAVPASSHTLAARRQLDVMALGMQPVTVIRGDSRRDHQRVVAALWAGESLESMMTEVEKRQLNGVCEFIGERFDDIDNRLQRRQMLLSAVGRFVQTSGSGHAVIATEPQLVADEVGAVWESCLHGGI